MSKTIELEKLDFASLIRPGETVTWGQASGEPLSLTERLMSQRHAIGTFNAFIGASYFRLLGKNQSYGQSARGLALDCGETDRPEEFPIFTDWWLGKPSQGEDRLKMYAILDSVSCVGAYRFVIIPGDTTVMEVEAVLYFRDGDKVRAVNADRKPIKTIGMAPLTSMFWFGKASEKRFDDYRPLRRRFRHGVPIASGCRTIPTRVASSHGKVRASATPGENPAHRIRTLRGRTT